MRITVSVLSDLVLGAFLAHGFTEEEARACADEIVDCETRGRLSHGAAIVRDVIGWRTPPAGEWPCVQTIAEGSAHALLTGNRGVGPLVAARAMDLACDKADAAGLAMVAVRNPTAFVSAGFNVRRAAARGFVALKWCCTASRVAPYGSVDPVLGTNPIGIAVPAHPAPVVLDMSTSAIAGAEIRRLGRLGEAIPADVAVAADGHAAETADDALKGALRAFGGHRGSALAAMFELLTGAVLGVKTGAPDDKDRGMLFLVFKGDLFADADAVQAGVERLRTALGGARPDLDAVVPGAVMPGDRGDAARRRSLEEGVELPDAVYDDLRALAGGGPAR